MRIIYYKRCYIRFRTGWFGNCFHHGLTTSSAAYGIIGSHVAGPLLNTNDLKLYDEKCSHSFYHTIIPFNRVI